MTASKSKSLAFVASSRFFEATVAYRARAPTLPTPQRVLDGLDGVARQLDGFSAVGAWIIPNRVDDVDAWVYGATVFFSTGFPVGFLGELKRLWREHGASQMSLYARHQSAPFTITEVMRALQLRDTWFFMLMRDHGLRDGLYCPMRRWNVFFGSSRLLKLSPLDRNLITSAAQNAVARLEQLVKNPQRYEKPAPKLTARELEIMQLRCLKGLRPEDIARALAIGSATVDTLLQRAVKKIGARDVTHACTLAAHSGLI